MKLQGQLSRHVAHPIRRNTPKVPVHEESTSAPSRRAVFITMNLAVIASPKLSSPTVLCLAELFGQGRPQLPHLISPSDSRLNHDKLRDRGDTDALPGIAEQRELPSRPGKQP
jgi:hypothetical protein